MPDSRKQKITLREVRTDPSGDYLLEITSPGKAMTEASMNRQCSEPSKQAREIYRKLGYKELRSRK